MPLRDANCQREQAWFRFGVWFWFWGRGGGEVGSSVLDTVYLGYLAASWWGILQGGTVWTQCSRSQEGKGTNPHPGVPTLNPSSWHLWDLASVTQTPQIWPPKEHRPQGQAPPPCGPSPPSRFLRHQQPQPDTDSRLRGFRRTGFQKPYRPLAPPTLLPRLQTPSRLDTAAH